MLYCHYLIFLLIFFIYLKTKLLYWLYIMKRNIYFCDYCNVEKFDSESQEFIKLSFQCNQTQQWKRHINTAKHKVCVAKNKNFDNMIECKHCDSLFNKEQYAIHKERNQLLWTMKGSNELLNESCCNHFIVGNKRYPNIKELIICNENRYDSGRKKYEYTPKSKQIISFKEQGERILDSIEKKEKEVEEEDQLQLTIEDIEDGAKPQFDEFCEDCGNAINYDIPIEIIEKWDIETCGCESDEE